MVVPPTNIVLFRINGNEGEGRCSYITLSMFSSLAGLAVNVPTPRNNQLLLKEQSTKHLEDFSVCNEVLGPHRHMENWKNTKMVAPHL